MIHEYHVGGFVRRDAQVPVLLARGCAGLLAAQANRKTREGWGGDIKREEGMIGG